MGLSNEEYTRLAHQYERINQEKQQLEEEFKQVTVQQQKMEQTQTNLSDISKLPVDTEILVPVASGIFIKAKVTKENSFLVNVGAETLVPKDNEGVSEILEEQGKELNSVHDSMKSDLQMLDQQQKAIEKQLQED